MGHEPSQSMGWRSRGSALFAGHFLVRPFAHVDESFLGYRLRVAFANGLSNPDWLVCIESSLPKTHGVARWCPYCLADPHTYWREDWYTGPAACFDHQCWLTSECSVCRRMLHWKQVRFATCSCGASLHCANVDPFSVEVLNLLGEQTDSNSALLSVVERWNLARFLGALSQFGLQGKPLKKASRQTENVDQLLVTVGAPLIADQSACFELLDRLRAPQASVKNVPLLSEIFPNLLVILRRQLDEAQRGWMLNVLDKYVTSSSHRGLTMLWERKGTACRANKDLRCLRNTRNPAIANMLEQTGETIPVRRTRAGRKKFAISEEDLQRLRDTQRSLVPLKTAARYAGMSTRRIQALAQAGLIASNGTRIDTRSIDRLLSNIVEAGVRDVPAVGNPVSIAEALRLYVPVEASAAFFNYLMNGVVRLVVESDKVPALRQIIADRGHVISAVQMPVESCSQISIVEAARRLGVKQEVMYHLINIGLVRTRMGKLRRRVARIVDADELTKFSQQFLPLSTVARAMGISARQAPNWAREHGIEIVTGPSVDGGRQYWIRRRASVGVPLNVGSKA